jgi:DNA invertase Pin-like site-specific DNA recombinase
MSYELAIAGSASAQLATKAHEWWLEAARNADIVPGGFDPEAPLGDRIAWALGAGLVIATVYTRFSSKRQHSTEDQVRECLVWAAGHGMYVPPELISIDEATKGHRIRRDGLARLKEILRRRHASVLLVFKASRLFRQAFKGYQLIHEEVVEEGLRAVSVSQGIDTDDERSWKAQLQLHGLLDDLLLDAIADHSRAGLKGLFLKGWITGGLTVGYRRVEVPNAPVTNRGLPRTVPEVDPEVAKLILQNFEWIADGMPIKEGWRRWVAAGGPCDPRSPLGHMSYNAYRRMLSNTRYTGRWEFGRKRNQFSTKLDYVRQVEQPESEVEVYRCEELRIVPDELFFRVQRRLAELKKGPRGPRKRKGVQLWDLVTEIFWCARCEERFYQTGAHGRGMQCKNGDLCPCKSAVRRDEATRAVCGKLAEVILRDAHLLREVLCRAREIDARGDDDLQAEIATEDRKVQALTARISDLADLAGQGSKDDREQLKAKIRSAQAERASRQLRLTRLRAAADRHAESITPEHVDSILADFAAMLENAAEGKLGDDAVYKASNILRQLVGGRIWVHVERRPGRKQTVARGVFRPHLIRTVKAVAGVRDVDDEEPTEDVEVWLRKPPRLDLLAERVHQLVDLDGLSYRETAKKLREEGHKVNSGNVWYSYRRHYEIQGLPVPERPYNNGRPRRSA